MTWDGRPAAGGEYVNLRSLHYALSNASGQKGFCLYVCYFVLYVALIATRYDSPAGYSSLAWLNDAVEKEFDFLGDCDARAAALGDGIDCFDPFNDRGDKEELAGFLGDDLARLVLAVKTACPHCQVALTRQAVELDQLGLDEYICTDFATAPAPQGTLDEPTFADRGCDAVDARWRAAPRLDNPPCCGGGDHIRASLTLRTKLYLGEGAQLRRADGSFDASALYDEDVSARAVSEYVSASLQLGGAWEDSVLAHLVIRRADHFTGIVYSARLRDARWLPGLVKARTSYYSIRVRPTTLIPLIVFAVVFWVLTAVHELLNLLVAWRAGRLRERVLSAHFALVDVPSLVLPWVVSALNRLLRQDQHVFATSVVEVVMFVRVFTDGVVVPPLRIIVKTVSNAIRQLSMFSVVVIGTCAFVAVLNMQMFGVFEEDFKDFRAAFTAVFMIIVEGSPLDGDRFEVAPAGAYFLLFVANFAVFLMQAQFFIAILVGAFDATREAEEATESARQLPAGFEPLPREQRAPASARLAALAAFFATYRFHGAFAWDVLPDVDVAVGAAEERVRERCAALGAPYEPGSPLMVSRAQLEALLGAAPAAHVLGVLGARCVAPAKVEPAVLVPPRSPADEPPGGGADGPKGGGAGAAQPTPQAEAEAEAEGGEGAAASGPRSRRRARARDGGGAYAAPPPGGGEPDAPPYADIDPATGEPVVRARVRARRRAAAARAAGEPDAAATGGAAGPTLPAARCDA